MASAQNAAPLEEEQVPGAVAAQAAAILIEEPPAGENGGDAAGQQSTIEAVLVKEEGAAAPLESGQPESEPIALDGGLESIVEAAAGLAALQAPGPNAAQANPKSPNSQDTESLGVPASLGEGLQAAPPAEDGAGSRPVPDPSGLPVLPPAASRERSRRDSPLVCHIVGCSVNLAVQAEYYQRYRICRDHLRSPALIVEGIPQRFCQQCGRFHLLDAFDGDKRNCRARLAQHNSRRRKVGTASVTPYGAPRRGIDGDDVEYDPAGEMERLRRTDRSAFGLTSKSYPGPGGFARHDSDPQVGSRRPRDALEQLYNAAAGVTMPPMLRSRPLDTRPPPQMQQQHQQQHHPQQQQQQQAEDPSMRQHAMQSLLSRFYSEPPLSNNVGPPRQSSFPPAFTSAIREVEAMLGRQVMQALLQEGGMMSSMPQSSSSNFLGLQGHDLLKLLQRGNGNNMQPAPFAPPPHPPPMTFGGGMPAYNSAAVHPYNNPSFPPHHLNHNGPSGQFPGFQSAAGNHAVEALRHLAATVPRSGYAGPGGISLPPANMHYQGMPPHQQMTPQQHHQHHMQQHHQHQQQQQQQQRPLQPPGPVNPFSQHRDAMLQQLAAAAVASTTQPSQSPEPPHQQQRGEHGGSENGGAPGPSPPAAPPINVASGGGGGAVQPPAAAAAGPGPSSEQTQIHQRNLSDEPGLQSNGMQQLLSLLRSQVVGSSQQGGQQGGPPQGFTATPPPPLPPMQTQEQNQLFALLQQMAVIPSVGATGTH